MCPRSRGRPVLPHLQPSMSARHHTTRILLLHAQGLLFVAAPKLQSAAHIPNYIQPAVACSSSRFWLFLVIVIGQRHNFRKTHCEIVFYLVIVCIPKPNMPSVYVEILSRSTNPIFHTFNIAHFLCATPGCCTYHTCTKNNCSESSQASQGPASYHRIYLLATELAWLA